MMAHKVWKEPYLLIQALDALDTITPETYIYFQDNLATVEPFRKMKFKLRKQTSRTVPDGWEIEKGGVVVLTEDGLMVGKLPPEKVEKYGLSTSRVYYGYVLPPVVDYYDGYHINDRFVPNIFV